MTDNIAKITKVVLWVLIALSFFFALMLFISGEDTLDSWISNALTFTQILLYLTAGATIFFSLYIYVMIFMARPKKALVKLIPILLLGTIFIIAYSTSSDAILDMPNYDGEDNTPTNVVWGGAGILTTYILLGLAVLSILYVSIARWFK